MGQEYDNSGILFKNDRKQQPNHPDYTGSAKVGGIDYWISAWVKEGTSGKLAGRKFFSLSFKPKEGGGYGSGRQQQANQEHGERRQVPEEEIPF